MVFSEEERRKRHSEACQRYNAAKTRQIPFRLNLETDADIIEWLDAQPNKNRAIREALRAMMAEEDA